MWRSLKSSLKNQYKCREKNLFFIFDVPVYLNADNDRGLKPSIKICIVFFFFYNVEYRLNFN